MHISFESIQIGKTFTRPYLARLWGYAGQQAIARGAVTPRNTQYIILFITREKLKSETQYENQLENGLLEIQGETNHVADERMINAANVGDEIHLFYRDLHRAPFTYYGQIGLIHFERHATVPSRFEFRVPSELLDDSLETELTTHGIFPDEFTPDEEGKKKIGRHVTYERSARNRRRALEIHGHQCMACGFDFNEVYGAEYARSYIEVHHVKSITKTQGPVNPETDLAPLCSNCHSMAHRKRGEILTVEEIKTLLNENA